MSGVQKRGAGTNRASYPSGALRVCRACVGWWIEYESEAHVRWESKRFLGGGLGCFVVLGGFLVCSSLALRVGVGFLGGGSGWYGGLACASGWYGGLACASGWCGGSSVEVRGGVCSSLALRVSVGVLRWRFGVVWDFGVLNTQPHGVWLDCWCDRDWRSVEHPS